MTEIGAVGQGPMPAEAAGSDAAGDRVAAGDGPVVGAGVRVVTGAGVRELSVAGAHAAGMSKATKMTRNALTRRKRLPPGAERERNRERAQRPLLESG